MEMPGESGEQSRLGWTPQSRCDSGCASTAPTYPEVIVHIAGEDGAVIVWPLQVGRLGVRVLPKLFFEPFLVVDHNLFAFRFHQANEHLDDLESAAAKRDKNESLAKL